MVAYEPWPAWVEQSINEIERKFDLTGGTYRGHADGDPGHNMTGDLAADFWTTDKLKHDAVLAWFKRNAVRIGATYIITWRRIWSVARADEGVRVYDRYGPDANASQAHTNHVHISYGTTPPPEDEDVATPKEIATEVWDYAIDNFKGPGNDERAETAIRLLGSRTDDVELGLERIEKTLAVILARLPVPPA